MSEHQPEPVSKPADPASMSEETASLLGLIDRLGSLLERSDLIELEVESGETGISLRKPAALLPLAQVGAAGPVPGSTDSAPNAPAAAATTEFVKAPLTGIYYGSSSPGSPPFVTVGQQVALGQVIGLIEAMKLFNEIKSDQAGRVVRLVAESGKLVKAKSPLIEVEP